MQRSRRDDDLASFFEFCNLPSESQVDLNFPDDVLAHAQGDQLQNNGSLENRNLMQNPNPFFSNLNPNQNRVQERNLFSPFANMHLNPNPNNLTEPWHRPYYQPNPEFCMPSDLLSNRNQDMARPPCQINTNVASNSNIGSTSRGETNISRPSRKRGDEFRSIQTQSTGLNINHPSYSGIGNFVSESVQQNNEGFVRRTRMRLDPGQPRTSMVTVSPGTAQYSGFPRPNLNPGQSMAIRALASNTLPTALAGGAFVPRVGTNTSHMQIRPATTIAPAPVEAARVRSQSQYMVHEALPVALPLSHHHRAQNAAVPAPVLAPPALVTARRAVPRQQPIRAIVSSGASELRSQGVFVNQAVPTIPRVPASSAVYVFVPNETASTSQTGNSGALGVQERRRSLPLIRTRPPVGTSDAAPSQVRLADNMITYREPRVYYQGARARQFEMLLITTEMLDEWRQIDSYHDMRLDTDNMSFEELLALEERIGTVSTGVSEQTVNEHMRCMPFSALLEKGSETCCICQEEYMVTDEVGTLDCGHDFHTECIKKWLAQKNICPICKMRGIKP